MTKYRSPVTVGKHSTAVNFFEGLTSLFPPFSLSVSAVMVQGWKWSRRRSHFPLIFLICMVVITATVLFNEYKIDHFHHNHLYQNQGHNPHPQHTHNFSPVELDRFTTCSSTIKYNGREVGWEGGYRHSAVAGGVRECDVFSGKWVYDNASYPLYNESHCPYMSDQLACQKHGRPDLGYQYWRWQPNDCNLKRWNVTEMWEKLRGKRLMFVGDSLNRGQWISMVCLLQSVIPADKRSMSPNAHLTVFQAEEYNASVEFLWAPLLVDSNSDDPVNHRLSDRIIRPDSASRHLSKWENADILVFNTYLWWRQEPVKLLWRSEENRVCEELDGLPAMELAMKTWANWVDSNVKPHEKRVFFVTMSPTHLWSQEWNSGSEGNCYNESSPITRENYWGSGSDLPTMNMVHDILSQLGSKVTVLNITQLSEYRKDGHPSIHRKFWETLSPEQLSKPESYSDCIHWCLPGVPDTWNQLLFHFL